MTTPNTERIQLFVDALRSGEYEQGNDVLGHKTWDFEKEQTVEKFCCLGVASEVAIKNGLPLTRQEGRVFNGVPNAFCYVGHGYTESNDTRGIYLHPEIAEWYGFNRTNPVVEQSDAAHLNDEKKLTFAQIADAFESTYLRPAVTEPAQ